MQQLSFPFIPRIAQVEPRSVGDLSFSHNHVCDDAARVALEDKYAHLLEETHKFSRRIVSFQANKIEALHSWIKYREGFSAQLVEILFTEFGIQPGQTVLDPFAGSCTTMLEAQLHGIDAVGIELLPHCHLAWEAKSRAFSYNVDELTYVGEQIRTNEPPRTEIPFPHLNITESAFPPSVERNLVDYALWFDGMPVSDDTKILCRASIMSILEDISYTRKDGQYLRWDARADKIIRRNQGRIKQGKKPVKGIDKGTLPTVKEALLRKLDTIIRDVVDMQKQPPPSSHQVLIRGNTLYELPRMEPDQFDAVITSPPYANRYDYTRTYALELAFLNVQNNIFQLRQDLLSCTVENRPKTERLEDFYADIGQQNRYEAVMKIVHDHPALNEIRTALEIRNHRGEINNKGVLRMIDQYFSELTLIYAELYRTCKSGARVAFVNDNVRYAGEVIPVDLLSTDLAQLVGFRPVKVYVLPQRKGNSSQQMGKFGRRELRKSITIWEKP